MEEDKKRGAEAESSSIAAILRERERLDRELQKKFKKEVTIVFTDICGYTKYMETRGDISGRAMLQKHNDIIFPLVEKHEGVVIKTIGDAVMATFANPLAGVKASIAIQNGLYEYNREVGAADRIHVKIGINKGEALMDKADVFGDVVNAASRIQSQAGPDQILISKTVYEQVGGSEDILCRLHETVKVKGKAEPLELYRVLWQDEDIVLSTEPRVRTPEGAAERGAKLPLKVLQIEITQEENHLKISAHELVSGETSTIIHYEEIPVHIDRINARCHEIIEILNNANRKGRLTREVLVKLRETGQVFSDELFTLNVKEKVKNTKADHLILNLDDQLVHVPWELLHDGQQFLCQRFNMGRLVRTRQTIMGSKTRLLARPLRMMILADPKGDLKEAYQEGTQIRDSMDRYKDFVNVSLRSGDVTPDFIREKIRNFDFIHFAGHADYNRQNPGESGWQLTSGIMKSKEIIKMTGTATMPALVFSNACQSARTEEWSIKEGFQDEIFGLANAFILSGVKHYVGTFWEILDEPSRHFALEFYKNLLSDVTVGEAMRLARMKLINKFGEETIVWASYLLYGDPTSNYMAQVKGAEVQEEPAPPSATPSKMGIRAREEVIDFAEKEGKRKKSAWWAATAVIIALVAFLFWGYPGFLKQDTEKYETAALTYYSKGNFEEALNACNILEEKSPNTRLTYLLRGDIYLRSGKLDTAEAAYKKALEVTKGTDLQKAKTFIGLGRIASVRKLTDEALNYYKQATEAAPDSGLGYLSQALLLDNKGNHKEAMDLLGKARELAPKDQVLAAITRETHEKVSLAQDQEKQNRINRMVKELLESMKSPPRALPSDGWTSPPLTMWIMDFGTQGYSLQEGEERFLASGITDQLIQHSRVRLVERAILDKLLEELKLGASRLVDRSTALSLGKILAARLILSGQVVYSGPQTQVSMRLIETETGRISAAVNESFGSAVPASVLADKLSKPLLEKLATVYPLRGKISEMTDKEIRLNIGQNAGIMVGQRLKVIDEDVTLEVISVQADTSSAKIAKGEQALLKGLRVETE